MESLKNIAIKNRLLPMIIAGLAVMISVSYLLNRSLNQIIESDLNTELEYQRENILQYKEQETALLHMLTRTAEINYMVRYGIKRAGMEYNAEKINEDIYNVKYKKIRNPIDKIVMLNYWGRAMHSQARARETGVEVFNRDGIRVAGSLGDNRMAPTLSYDPRVEHVLGKNTNFPVNTIIQDLELNQNKLFYKTFIGLGDDFKRDEGAIVLTSMLNNNVLNSMKHGQRNNLILMDKDYNIIEDTFANLDEFDYDLDFQNFDKVNEIQIQDKSQSMKILPLENFDNEVIAYLGVIKDISVFRQLQRNLNLLIFSIVAFVFTATFLISIRQVEKYIVLPIRKIIQHMKILKNKNYKLIENKNLPLELNDLVDTYNKMSLKIREHIENINEKNEIINEKNQDLRELVAEKEKLYMRAIRDGLTGLYNHSFFKKELEKEIIRSRRYDRNFSLIMLDIDDFKEKNDTYGHQYGDEVLKKLSMLLKEESRTNDIIGRYGGEEITIILPETDIQSAYDYAEKLRKKIKNMKLKTEITVSMGICEYTGDLCERKNIEDVEKFLIERADTAMYFAKNSGKDKVEEYKEFME
ncbi:MAG: diguanylate cyclase [Fusobacteriota bacterium]